MRKLYLIFLTFTTFSINLTVDDELKMNVNMQGSEITALSKTIQFLEEAIKKVTYQKLFTTILRDLGPRNNTSTRVILSKKQTEYFPGSKTLYLSIYEKQLDYFIAKLNLLQAALYQMEGVSFESITPAINWETGLFLITEKNSHADYLEKLDFTTSDSSSMISTDGKSLSVNINKIKSENPSALFEIHRKIYDLNQVFRCNDKNISFNVYFDDFLDLEALERFISELNLSSNKTRLCSFVEAYSLDDNWFFHINNSYFHYLISNQGKNHIFWGLTYSQESSLETVLETIFVTAQYYEEPRHR